MKLTRDQAAVKVDWDGPVPYSLYDVTRLLRRAGYVPVAAMLDTSPSGTGTHMILHVSPRPTSPYEVVALALLLGSDPYREAMQLYRARAFSDVPRFMRDAWNVLYAPHPHRSRKLSLRRVTDD